MTRDAIKIVRRSLKKTSIPEMEFLCNVCGLDEVDKTIAIDGFVKRENNIQLGLKLNLCPDAIAKRKVKIIERFYLYKLFEVRKESNI